MKVVVIDGKETDMVADVDLVLIQRRGIVLAELAGNVLTIRHWGNYNVQRQGNFLILDEKAS
mgnify:CR=1 FL=1